jgi:hypothetical protein
LADDELTALREEYQTKFDKKPYHGWDVETLKQKLAGGPLDRDGDGKPGGSPPQTLSVFLLYDTWINDERIRANPEKAVDLPRDRAKELLKIGKALRADPLPGDE